MSLSDLVSEFSHYVKRYNDIEITQMCGLTLGTTAATLQTQNPIVFVVYNTQVTYPVTNNITMTACAVQDPLAVGSFCYYLVSIDINSGVHVTKGVDNTDALPSAPSGTVAVGAFLITTVGVSFTSGTTAFSAAGITAEFFDIDCGIAAFLIQLAQRRLERGCSITRNGRQVTVMDWDYMLQRADDSVVQGDSSIVLPYPGFKDFMDNGLTITDTSGVTYPMEKYDIVETGVVFQSRPLRISRLPSIETVFTPEGLPAREFDIWPQSDQDYTIDTIAYCYSPKLDGILYTDNWVSIYAPDILLFGALVEGVSFFSQTDPRTPEWEKRWMDAVWTLYQAEQKQKHAGTYIYTRYPVIRRRESLGMASNKAGIMSFGYVT
jgi:hypothetical protein